MSGVPTNLYHRRWWPPGCHHTRSDVRDRGRTRSHPSHSRSVRAAEPCRPRGPSGAYDPPSGGPVGPHPRRRGVQAGQEPAHQRARERAGMPGGRRPRDLGADGGSLRGHPVRGRSCRLHRDVGRRRVRRAGRGDRAHRLAGGVDRRSRRPEGHPRRRRRQGLAAAPDPQGRSRLRRHPRCRRPGVEPRGEHPGGATHRGRGHPRVRRVERVHRAGDHVPAPGPRCLPDCRLRAVQDRPLPRLASRA